MKVDRFTAWYQQHAGHILANDDKAQESYEVLERAEKLHLYERVVQKKKNKVNWEIVLKVISMTLSFGFNILLCGCIFQYERFAPIITRCFGFVKPAPI